MQLNIALSNQGLPHTTEWLWHIPFWAPCMPTQLCYIQGCRKQWFQRHFPLQFTNHSVGKDTWPFWFGVVKRPQFLDIILMQMPAIKRIHSDRILWWSAKMQYTGSTNRFLHPRYLECSGETATVREDTWPALTNNAAINIQCSSIRAIGTSARTRNAYVTVLWLAKDCHVKGLFLLFLTKRRKVPSLESRLAKIPCKFSRQWTSANILKTTGEVWRVDGAVQMGISLQDTYDELTVWFRSPITGKVKLVAIKCCFDMQIPILKEFLVLCWGDGGFPSKERGSNNSPVHKRSSMTNPPVCHSLYADPPVRYLPGEMRWYLDWNLHKCTLFPINDEECSGRVRLTSLTPILRSEFETLETQGITKGAMMCWIWKIFTLNRCTCKWLGFSFPLFSADDQADQISWLAVQFK